MILGINASRARSGGAKLHIFKIISNLNPILFDINKIHIWAEEDLLLQLPNKKWLQKHDYKKKNIFIELFWEFFMLPILLIKNNCDILFNVDSGSVCRFKPCVSLNQDILCFENDEVTKLGYSYERLRQIILKFIQSRTLYNSNGTIFLTNYAVKLFKSSINNKFYTYKIIPHGIDKIFKYKDNYQFDNTSELTIKCLYVSPIWSFKHQWNVVKAISQVRNLGYNINLTLIGRTKTPYFKKLKNEIDISDPKKKFVQIIGEIKPNDLKLYYANSDIFIFASSVESFGITLLEAMSYGLPIACSELSSMSETLGNSGHYFNPYNIASIKSSIIQLIADEKKRKQLGISARIRSNNFSWAKTTFETFQYIQEIHQKYNKTSNV